MASSFLAEGIARIGVTVAPIAILHSAAEPVELPWAIRVVARDAPAACSEITCHSAAQLDSQGASPVAEHISTPDPMQSLTSECPLAQGDDQACRLRATKRTGPFHGRRGDAPPQDGCHAVRRWLSRLLTLRYPMSYTIRHVVLSSAHFLGLLAGCVISTARH